MISFKQAVIASILIISSVIAQAQQVTIQQSDVRFVRRIDKTTPITDVVTGQPVTIEQYDELLKTDQNAWHLTSVFDEFGEPMAYTLRKATPEEYETHQFKDRDPAQQPQVGQIITPFVMKGIDGKIYRSADLIGKVVVLSFWVSINKPFWNEKISDTLTTLLQPYQSRSDMITLGILNSSPAKIEEYLQQKPLPFVAVPNARGFHEKYNIINTPTIVVIDKTGKVAANLHWTGNFDALKDLLATLLN